MPCNFYDNKDNNDNGKNGRNRGCHEVIYNRDNRISSAITVLLCVFLRQLILFFYDNRDNRDNGKNGRNRGCHEVTYNRDNNDYCCQLVFFTKLSTLIIYSSLHVIKDQPVRLY